MDKDKKIKILQDVIKIESVNGKEKRVAEYIQNLLAEYGIDSKLISYGPERSNLVAEISHGDGPVLGLTGHMDVVVPGDLSLWKYPPFAAEIEGDRLYGRGATDMKSGLMAMVIGMIELKESGLPFNGTLRLLATVGEEIGELGSEQLTKAGYIDDLAGLIVGEPSNYNLVYTHMGSINYRVRSIGKEAHSSMPDLGINAIDHLLPFMTEINQKMAEISQSYSDEVLGQTIHNLTVIEGGSQVNSIPGEATVQGNIRSIPAYSNEKIIKDLTELVKRLNQQSETTLELTIDYDKLPVKSAADSKLIQVIQSVVEKQQGQKMPLLGVAGTTDAAEFIKGKQAFDFVVFGPGEPTLPHQINEYVLISNYLDMSETYQEIAKNYLK
ncbi:ArgE/DapE family deacylase [Vagococcus salmoninarum]|uniref:Probable succinyl-diaminopimelate desuccinylase n=1 Tax=Vagococcus salmoninarum TaxID=2739 RepID=A0A429ZPY7_9ENTE|nr:ArgE/DapE family deacylase [Vagococcus salmoninarum]RST95746.1 succinyl-diaminopimelate desuccinylase [Vagococcus salmoninarum]